VKKLRAQENGQRPNISTLCRASVFTVTTTSIIIIIIIIGAWMEYTERAVLCACVSRPRRCSAWLMLLLQLR